MAWPLERGISAFAIWHLLLTAARGLRRAGCGMRSADSDAARTGKSAECRVQSAERRLQLKIRLHMNFSKCFLR